MDRTFDKPFDKYAYEGRDAKMPIAHGGSEEETIMRGDGNSTIAAKESSLSKIIVIVALLLSIAAIACSILALRARTSSNGFVTDVDMQTAMEDALASFVHPDTPDRIISINGTSVVETVRNVVNIYADVTTLESDLIVVGNISTDYDISASQIQADNLIGTDVTATGRLFGGDFLTNALRCNGDSVFNGNVSVSGTLSVTKLNLADDLTVSGLVVTGDVHVENSLTGRALVVTEVLDAVTATINVQSMKFNQGGSMLSWFEELTLANQSFTCGGSSLTQESVVQEGILHLTRIGNTVTLISANKVAGTTTSTCNAIVYGSSDEIKTYLPPQFRPASSMTEGIILVRDINYLAGYATVSVDGSVDIKTLGGLNFTVGTIGFQTFSLAWRV